ncbi:hypothetical protein NBRC111894_3565 [Sporolactobacillus inulinus]|uniref:Uncharacterized protein n=1 Tax=Sporolactobacillus inulinus TaxID=2078 RepID=A0A4Y1ZGC1_9BACL|nr:hypothetical protein NBRC111894_3565 [Sporolactobacillus inulinus]
MANGFRFNFWGFRFNFGISLLAFQDFALTFGDFALTFGGAVGLCLHGFASTLRLLASTRRVNAGVLHVRA